jgi:SulP family sulfate permease
MSGAEMLQTIQKKLKSRGVELYLGAVKKPVREYLEKGNFIEHIGKNRVFIDEEDALKAIYAEMDKQICNSCPAQVFSFCPKNQ